MLPKGPSLSPGDRAVARLSRTAVGTVTCVHVAPRIKTSLSNKCHMRHGTGAVSGKQKEPVQVILCFSDWLVLVLVLRTESTEARTKTSIFSIPVYVFLSEKNAKIHWEIFQPNVSPSTKRHRGQDRTL